ncbi:LamG domain-containing protein [Bacteroidota bacterium]
MNKIILVYLTAVVCLHAQTAKTIVLWCFDEQKGIYPSCILSDLSDNDYPLVLGSGGMIVSGRYGNALDAFAQPEIRIEEDTSKVRFGLANLKIPEGRTQPPMSWFNSNFTALMTSGENHLRKEAGFAQVTKTRLNLGSFDWTVEFWFYPQRESQEEGVVFEIGSGPRAENDIITRLVLNSGQDHFTISNQPAGTKCNIKTELKPSKWQHLAFTYDAGDKQLNHYVDGKLQSTFDSVLIKSLPEGNEDYMSIARDGIWNRPLQGKLDELRISEGIVYTSDFTPPRSFSYLTAAKPQMNLIKGPSLLIENINNAVIDIGSRKHLFIDDLLFDEKDNKLKFVVNPPQPAEIVLTDIEGTFRKHLCVLEDEKGMIRIYTTVDDDYLAVWISEDGINFSAPELPKGKYKGHKNIVLHERVGMGIVFLDPNAPKEERWKYISDYHRRAVSLFYSESGLEFKRYKQPVLPFRSGSQANIYYDEQKQVYTAFHRSDFGRTIQGATQRDFVMTETKDLLNPWPFDPLSQEDSKLFASGKRTAELMPWYLDNGPLSSGGFSLEYPFVFSPIDNYDPPETDIYVPKAMKYPWAPDTYLSFPIIYFHYEDSIPETRRILEDENRLRGSGPLETQLAISRNGVDWKRYPRPAYVGIGEHGGIDFKTSYIAHGMIKRGGEIWQYNFGEPHYHSPWVKYNDKRSVYRLVQRLDGFVSLDSPYDKDVYAVTKPIEFEGNRLVLNIDTDAAGYVQVGFLDEIGNDIEGFSVDDCVYINGDFIDEEVEWMKNRSDVSGISNSDEEDAGTISANVITSKDVSELQGKIVKLIFRMRGSKLYAMHFVNRK